MNEQGTVSLHTENIFPIIKKFLYSDQDIFLRELVASGVDAIQKLKKLTSMGSYAGPTDQLSVCILINQGAKTLTIQDDGLGMTAEEIKSTSTKLLFRVLLSLWKSTKSKQSSTNSLVFWIGILLGLYGGR